MKFDKGDLLRYLDEQIEEAEQYIDGDVATERSRALDYYLRRDDGSEEDGRSRTHDRTVFKTVQGLSTAIANIFISEKTAIEFTPKKAGFEKQAKEQTALVSYVLFAMNSGFTHLYEAIKDGVLSKTGFLTWRWEIDRTVKKETYRNQSEQSIQMLQADPTVRIESVTTTESGYDVTLLKTSERGAPIIESVPPEEIIVSPLARSCDLQKAPFVAWRRMCTRQELLAQGYELELIESLESDSVEDYQIDRDAKDFQTFSSESVRVYTCWTREDMDGDGVPELRRIVRSGDVILENEITDEINLSAWTPNPNPHEFIGRCPADDAVFAQIESTAVRRQMMDNLYLANNPVINIDAQDPRVNMEDLLDWSIGKPMRAPPGSIGVTTVPFVAQHSFGVLQQLQDESREVTGNSVLSSGVESSSFNSTATGAKLMAGHFEQTKQFMARMFGEMCLVPAMRGVAGLLMKHSDRAFNFRVAGSFHEIDPRFWASEFDLSCNVGLGVVDKQQQSALLQQISAAQQAAIGAGAMGQLLTLQHVYNVQAKIAENAGFEDVSQFWQDPSTAPPTQPQEPKQDPAIVKAQMDMQVQQAKLQQDAQLEQLKLQTHSQIKLQEAQLRAQTELQIAQMRESSQLQARVDQTAAMSRPAAQISVNAESAVGEYLAQMQQQAALQSEALAAALAANAQAIEQLAQAQQRAAEIAAAPKVGTTSSGKKIVVQTQV